MKVAKYTVKSWMLFSVLILRQFDTKTILKSALAIACNVEQLYVGCCMLGVACWMLRVGCCVLGVGCWVLGVTCCLLGVACCVLGVAR